MNSLDLGFLPQALFSITLAAAVVLILVFISRK